MPPKIHTGHGHKYCFPPHKGTHIAPIRYTVFTTWKRETICMTTRYLCNNLPNNKSKSGIPTFFVRFPLFQRLLLNFYPTFKISKELGNTSARCLWEGSFRKIRTHVHLSYPGACPAVLLLPSWALPRGAPPFPVHTSQTWRSFKDYWESISVYYYN